VSAVAAVQPIRDVLMLLCISGGVACVIVVLVAVRVACRLAVRSGGMLMLGVCQRAPGSVGTSQRGIVLEVWNAHSLQRLDCVVDSARWTRSNAPSPSRPNPRRRTAWHGRRQSRPASLRSRWAPRWRVGQLASVAVLVQPSCARGDPSLQLPMRVSGVPRWRCDRAACKAVRVPSRSQHNADGGGWKAARSSTTVGRGLGSRVNRRSSGFAADALSRGRSSSNSRAGVGVGDSAQEHGLAGGFSHL
jgi:hypothetical protein